MARDLEESWWRYLVRTCGVRKEPGPLPYRFSEVLFFQALFIGFGEFASYVMRSSRDTGAIVYFHSGAY